MDHETRVLYAVMLAGVTGAVTALTGCSGPRWRSDFERAARTAAEQDRLLLVEFSSLACRHCAKMDAEVFTDPNVLEAMEDLICVRLDSVLNSKLASERGVVATPTFFVLRPDGSEITSTAGAMSAREFILFLARARIHR